MASAFPGSLIFIGIGVILIYLGFLNKTSLEPVVAYLVGSGFLSLGIGYLFGALFLFNFPDFVSVLLFVLGFLLFAISIPFVLPMKSSFVNRAVEATAGSEIKNSLGMRDIFTSSGFHTLIRRYGAFIASLVYVLICTPPALLYFVFPERRPIMPYHLLALPVGFVFLFYVAKQVESAENTRKI